MAVARMRRVVVIVQEAGRLAMKEEVDVTYKTMTVGDMEMDDDIGVDEPDADADVDADDEGEEIDELDKDDETYLPPPFRNHPPPPAKASVKKPRKEPRPVVRTPKTVSTKNRRGLREKMFSCPHVGCNEIYTRPSDANRHGARCPMNPNGNQGVQCPHCHNWLSREDALSRHLRRRSCQRSGRRQLTT
jgi:hypothetical protein